MHPLDAIALGAGRPTQQESLLLVALLLCLWLFLLVRRREEEQQRQYRATPLTLEELGRTVVRAAMSRDLELYRSLFLNGAEAVEVLGDDGEAWIRARTVEVLDTSLHLLSERVGIGGAYQRLVREDPLDLRVLLISKEGDEFVVAIGSAVQVGLAWRLMGPPPA